MCLCNVEGKILTVIIRRHSNENVFYLPYIAPVYTLVFDMFFVNGFFMQAIMHQGCGDIIEKKKKNTNV